MRPSYYCQPNIPPRRQKSGRGFFGLFKKKKEGYRMGEGRVLSIGPNPWRGEKSVPGTSKKRRLLGFLAFVILVWLGLMLYLPYFRVTDLEITGLKTIDRGEAENFVRQGWLEGRRWLIFPAADYFLIKADKIRDQLTEKYLFETLTVEKIFPRLIKITAVEKISQIIYDNGDGYFLLDQQGTAINQLYPPEIAETAASSSEILATTAILTSSATSTARSTIQLPPPDFQWLKKQLPGLPVILDIRRNPTQIKQNNILSPAIIAAAINWKAALEKQGIGGVKYFELDNPAAGFKIYTDRGWYLLANPSDVESQLNNLKIILREEKPNEYIDLRYGERVFWK